MILEERRGERQETSVLTFPTSVQPLAMLLIYLLLPEILSPGGFRGVQGACPPTRPLTNPSASSPEHSSSCHLLGV